MKKQYFAALCALTLAACNTAEKPQTSPDPGLHTHEHPLAPGDVDPVCGMVRDSTWTDYTLYKGDTVWFCAAPEMKAFLANPDKYVK